MATRIVLKNSVEAGKVPLISDLVPGELALNLTDKKLYSKTPGGEEAEVFEIGSGKINGGETPPASGDGVGSLFFDTTTNQLLYWDGDSWEPVEVVMNLNDLADVEVAGATDKQVLVFNATSSKWIPVSAATLTVDVDLGYTANVAQGTVTNSAGDDAVIPVVAADKAGLMTPDQLSKLDSIPGDIAAPLWEQSSGVLSPKTSSDSVRIGGDQAAPHIALNSTGYSTFKGDVVIGDGSTYSSLSALLNGLPTYVADGFRNELRELEVDTADLLEQPIDEAFAQLPVDLVSSILRETPTGQINLSADGSGSFASNKFEINNAGSFFVNTDRIIGAQDGQLTIARDLPGSAFYCGTSTDRQNIVLNADGSATFVGYVQTDSNITVKSATRDGANAAIFAYDTASNEPYFTVSRNGGVKIGGNAEPTSSSTEKISLNADGSATFAGDVGIYSNQPDGRDNSSNELKLGFNNNLDLVKIRAVGAGSGGPGGSAGDLVFAHRGDNNSTFTDFTRFNYDGSATFAGNVVVNHSSASRAFIDGFGIYQTNTGGNNVISLLNDGSATFAGDIQCGGIYRNVTPTLAASSDVAITAQINCNNQDVANSISFVTNAPQNVTAGRVTTTGFQVNSGFGSDYADGARAAYGFKANMPAATNGKTFNFYAEGDAPNYFSGNVGIGTTIALDTNYGTSAGKLQISGTQLPVVFGAYSNDEFCGRLDFVKSRSSAINGKTIVQDGDFLGNIIFGGTDGSNVIPAARIDAVVDGTPGAGVMPGRLTFSTNGGATVPLERMRITSNGNIGIATTVPVQKLHVIGSSNDTIDENTGTARFEGSGGNGLLFGTQTTTFSSYIQSAFTNDTSLAKYHLLLNPLGGNVGINTTVPRNTLEVKRGANNIEYYPAEFDGYAASIINASDVANGHGLFVGNRYSSEDSTVLNVGSLYSVAGTFQPYLTVVGNGRVGIGTENPQYTLDVSGYIRTTTGIVFPDGSTQTTAQTGGGGTPANMVTTDTTQTISGAKTFNQINFNSKDALRLVSDGFNITRNNQWGDCGVGQGGMAVKFQDNAANIKIGVRNDNPAAAIDCCAAIKANQYQDRSLRATFDGRLFTSEDGIDFKSQTRFHNNVIQEGNLLTRIVDTPVTADISISPSERAAAIAIRAALRGFTSDGIRQFSIVKQSLIDAFSDNGLDVADYGIMSEITQASHDGFQDDDLGIDIDGLPAETYSAVNYQTLFAFVLAAGPDFSDIEARLTALENA